MSSADAATRPGQGLLARLAGALLLAASLAFFTTTVLRVPIEGSLRLGLDPRPDAEQYFAGAVSLYRSGTFTVRVGDRDFPPRYPFGYSLLMVPGFAAGLTPIHVPFLVNQAAGLAILLGVFGVLWKAGHEAAAGLACALVASWPSFVILCRSPLSEPTGSAVLLLACWRFTAFVATGRLRTGVAAGLLLGVSVWFRIANVFFLPLALFAALAVRGGLAARARAALAGGLGALAGMAPLLVYQYRAFGDPFRTGYALWVPYWAETRNAFRVEWAAANARYWWADLTGAEHPYTVANMFGNGAYLTPGLVALIALTAVTRLRRRADVAVAGALVASVAALLFYFFQDGRLLFPALLVCIPFAARESVVLVSGGRGRGVGATAGALLSVVLIVSALVGAPRRSGGSEARDFLLTGAPRTPNPRHALVVETNRVTGTTPATMLTNFGPWYIASLATAAHRIFPLDSEHRPQAAPSLFTDEVRAAAVSRALASGQAVYLLTEGPIKPEVAPRLEPPQGYVWETVASPGGSARLARLVPAAR